MPEETTEDINNQTAEQIEASNQKTEAEKRIKQLSEKVRLTSEERDEQKKLIEERDERIKELEGENAFNTGFSDVLANHPAANEYKDAIKEKVKNGYSVEDAAYAVLGKEGKLGTVEQAPQPQVAGGSADTTVTETANKEVKDMTQDERRSELEKILITS